MRFKRRMSRLLVIVMLTGILSANYMCVNADTLDDDKSFSMESESEISESDFEVREDKTVSYDEEIKETNNLDGSDILSDCSGETSEEIEESDEDQETSIPEMDGLYPESEGEIDLNGDSTQEINGWKCVIDDMNKSVTLIQYIGSNSDLIIPSKMLVKGDEYSVILQGVNSEGKLSFPRATKTITISKGVKAAEDISYLFNGSCIEENERVYMELTELNLSGLDTSQTKNMKGMFAYCENVKELNLANFNTSKVEDMSFMFDQCYSLEYVYMDSFDLHNVKDTRAMFHGCESLSYINVNIFDTSKVTNMDYMFCGCTSLVALDVSNFSTSSVISMQYMFSNLYELKELNIGEWDVSKVENMNYMFYQCLKLEEIDISSFDPQEVTKAEGMFRTCRSLKRIYCGEGLIWRKLDATTQHYAFLGCMKLVGGISYAEDKTSMEYAKSNGGYFTVKESGIDIDDLPFNIDDWQIVKDEIDHKAVFVQYIGNAKNIKIPAKVRIDGEDFSVVLQGTNEVSTHTFPLGVESIVIEDGVKAAEDISYLFDGFYMVDNKTVKSTLKRIDISGLDTSKTTRMTHMFGYCENLTQLDLSKMDTSQVTDMDWMFYMCKSLTSLDTSGFNTSKVRNMECMFYSCTSLQKLSIGFDMRSVKNMRGMFGCCENLLSMDMRGIDTHNVEDMSALFYGCTNLRSINFTGFDTQNATDMSQMFMMCENLRQLNLDSFNTHNVTNMLSMFWGCKKLEKIIISSFITTNVQNMDMMFYDCGELEELDLSSFETSYNDGCSLDAMFYGCSSLRTIFTRVDTNWTSLAGGDSMFFSGCSSLRGSVSFSPDKTSGLYAKEDGGYFTSKDTIVITPNNVYLFVSDDEHLSTAQLEAILPEGYSQSDLNWESSDDSIVTVQDGLLRAIAEGRVTIRARIESSSYISLCMVTVKSGGTLLNNWHCRIDEEKKNVILIQFLGDEEHLSIPSKFEINGEEYSVELQGTNDVETHTFPCGTRKITIEPGVKAASNISYLFNCDLEDTPFTISGNGSGNKIEELDLSGFDTSEVSNMSNLFRGCVSLTEIDLSGIDTAKVVDMSYMFYACSELEELDLRSFNTTNVKDMSYMFGMCKSVRKIATCSFDTKNVTSMQGMFSECPELKTVDVSGFCTDQVMDMQFMFSGCHSLSYLDVTGFNTKKVEYMSYMFCGCENIKKLDVSGFDTASVYSMMSMFDRCKNMTTIDVSNFVTDKVCSFVYMFSGCNSLETLDLSSFTVRKDANISGMFSGASSLKTIYTMPDTDWSKDAVARAWGSSVFNNCVSLSGDIKYSSRKITKEYAKVKGGYFTAKKKPELQISDKQVVVLPNDKDEWDDLLLTVELPKGYTVDNLKWESSNEDIAVVEAGRVHSINTGEVTIRVSTTDNEYVASCAVLILSKDATGGLRVVGIEDRKYQGRPIKQEIEVYDGITLLSEGKDYTINYKYNTNVASQDSKNPPTITIKGKGNYKATETLTFSITAKDISEADVSASEIASTAYNRKKAYKPIPVLTYNGKKLKNKTDFTVAYYLDEACTGATVDPKDPGKYYAKVTGTKNFTGSRIIPFEIANSEQFPVSKLTVVKIPDQPYNNGTQITPELVIKKGNVQLTKDTDYTLTYGTNTDIGTGTVVITGKEPYVGTKTVTFKITGGQMNKVSIGGFPKSLVYNGAAQTPALTLSYKAGKNAAETPVSYVTEVEYEKLSDAQKADIGCIVTYKNNVNTGKATVTFKGVNGYSGTVNKTFKITPFVVTNDPSDLFTITLDEATYPYAKAGTKPVPTVKYKDTVLTEGKDYTLSYANNTSVNDGSGSKLPTVKVTGKGNFKGTDTTTTFKIGQADMASTGVVVIAKDVVFQNKAGKWMPKYSVAGPDGKALKAGKDYDNKSVLYTYDAEGTNEVKAADIVPAGTTIYVKVNAKGTLYSGSATGSYRVVQNDIGKLSVTLDPKTYTGKAITLSPSDLTWKSGKKKVEGVTFEIDETTYKNNINKGKATVVVKGTGNYGGTKKITFTIGAKGFLWWWRNLMN